MRCFTAGLAGLFLFLSAAYASAAAASDNAAALKSITAVMPRVIAWRRDIHSHPELSAREYRTSKHIADSLRAMGLEVRTGVSHTGVVAVLRGGQPGRVLALRADMDALPVKEDTGLSFASTVTGVYNGNTVPVAHACGHDTHVAMLLGAAAVLTQMRQSIPGTILFIFQPAEEGAPEGVASGAKQMLIDGAFSNPKPDVIFGLHVVPGRSGSISYRSGGFQAAADKIEIDVKGKQTHAAWPWKGIDVISLGADIVGAFSTLVARQTDLTDNPPVLSIATFNAGVRNNIIPENLVMTGTLRTFSPSQQTALVAQIKRVVQNLAANYGASAQVKIEQTAPAIINDPGLSRWISGSLREASNGKLDTDARATTVADDFAYFGNQVPAVFYHLGATKPGIDLATAPPNHSPKFDVDEAALEVGVRAHVLTALNYLNENP